MELTSEEIVTKLLSSNEILRVKNKNSYIPDSQYDLGDFLRNININDTTNPNEEKYVFIK